MLFYFFLEIVLILVVMLFMCFWINLRCYCVFMGGGFGLNLKLFYLGYLKLRYWGGR